MDFVSVYLRLILSCFISEILAHIVAKYIRSWSDYACINSLVVREFQVQTHQHSVVYFFIRRTDSDKGGGKAVSHKY